MMIQRLRVSSKRKTMCGARRRTLLSETTSRSMDQLRHEGARRDHAGLDIGEIERVELRPKHVAFEAQRGEDRFLVGAGLGMRLDVGESKIDVLRRLRQPRREVGERVLG